MRAGENFAEGTSQSAKPIAIPVYCKIFKTSHFQDIINITWGCFGLDRAIVRVRLRVAELFCVTNEPENMC